MPWMGPFLPAGAYVQALIGRSHPKLLLGNSTVVALENWMGMEQAAGLGRYFRVMSLLAMMLFGLQDDNYLVSA